MIRGPSGGGKTTLLNLIGTIDLSTSGQLYIMGQRIDGSSSDDFLSRLRLEHIGFVFQSYHLLDDLTVYENLEIPLSYRDMPKKERESVVCDVLDKFGIVGKKDLYPSQLSGGQQQLVGVARALIAKPSLILADEPTGNLHSDQGREIMKLFKQLNAEGTTIIQVTHSAENATYGSRVIRLADGLLVN